jgi:hypothetical protein
MRLERDSASIAEARTPCLPYDTSRQYVLRLHSLAEAPGAGCTAAWNLYRTADCSDSPGLGALFDQNTQAGVWQLLETFTFFSSESIPPLAYRFRLVTGPQTAPNACNFDNIVITGEQIESIPALGWGGAIALAAAMSAVALILLHRAR